MAKNEGKNFSENYDEVMANKIETKRQEVFRKLLLRIGSQGPPLTVAIIGTPGSGKSSFINTVITSITREWRNYATVGHFGQSGDAKLQHSICYEKEKYLEFAEDKTELLKYNFPTLIDLAGFIDANDHITRKLLDLVFFGRIPPNAILSDVVRNIQNRTTNLEEIYPCSETNIKVDRVIFVVSASNRSPPFNLMRSLYSSIVSGPRAIPVFGVITKIDEPFTDLYGNEYKAFLTEFKSGLGILDNNLVQCTNYCDKNLFDIKEGLKEHLPNIDTPVLQFLRQVLDPVQKVVDNEEYRKKHGKSSERDQTPPQEEHSNKHSNSLGLQLPFNNFGEWLMVAILILLVAVFIILFLK